MKQFFALFFAVLLLTTTVGLSLATHYCGGEVFKNSISVLGKESPACDMQESTQKNCHNSPQVQNKSCCEDHAVTLQIEDQYNNSTSTALDHSAVFLASFTISYLYLILPTDAVTAKITYYDPPVLELDIPVLIQSFLI